MQLPLLHAPSCSHPWPPAHTLPHRRPGHAPAMPTPLCSPGGPGPRLSPPKGGLVAATSCKACCSLQSHRHKGGALCVRMRLWGEEREWGGARTGGGGGELWRSWSPKGALETRES